MRFYRLRSIRERKENSYRAQCGVSVVLLSKDEGFKKESQEYSGKKATAVAQDYFIIDYAGRLHTLEGCFLNKLVK